MSKNKDVTMGLPRLSGKRNWSETDGSSETDVPPSKVLCTSPPHGICAEDVPQNSPPTSSRTADTGCDKMDDKSVLRSEDTTGTSYEHMSESEEDENFIDDEEDKDSGFIDGNSIDNSSDDDDSNKETSFTTATFGSAVNFDGGGGESSISLRTCIEEGLLAEAKVTAAVSVTLTTDTTSSQCVTEPKMSVSTSFSSCGPTFCNTLTPSVATTFSDNNVLVNNSTTTAASTLTATVVTSTYQGSVSSLSYDLHPYPNMHPADPYFHRPGTNTWSCNFYDGSHPNTNKYMEISPNRSLPSQSIQCAENGKSYIELGSAAPYNNSYTAGCSTDFTTAAQSTYQNSTYTSTFAGGANNFAPSSPPYYNSRQTYGQNFNYGHGDSYNYENDTLNGYGYSGNYGGNGLLRGNNGMLNRSHSRCTSPYCDPGKGSVRSACYNQQRLTVFNMSMFKLNRFSRFPEPNLHRSVLICNTLRQIEKEFDSEGISMASIIASHNQSYGPPQQHHPQSVDASNQNNGASLDNLPSMSHSSSNNEGPLPSIHTPIVGGPLQLAPFCPSTTNQSLSTPPPLTSGYNSSPALTCPTIQFSSVTEHKESVRPYSQSPIPTAPPAVVDGESESSSWSSRISTATGGEEKTEDINWCSVLSLSSQSDLDSVSNNECSDWSAQESIVLPYPANAEDATSSEKLPSLSADDVLKSFPETRRAPEPTGEIESLIKDMLES